MSELRVALEGLTTHPGFQLFKQEAKRRWGPIGYARELKLAVSQAIEKNQSVEAAIKAVDRANDEVNSLFSWVDDSLRQAQHAEDRDAAVVPLSRRGPSL